MTPTAEDAEGRTSISLPADPSHDCGRTGIRMSLRSCCHTRVLFISRKIFPKINKKKEKESRFLGYDCKNVAMRSSPAAGIKAITCRGWNTVTLIFNRMCFIASYLQSDLSDPTNHKWPYQRRISALLGVVKKRTVSQNILI